MLSDDEPQICISCLGQAVPGVHLEPPELQLVATACYMGWHHQEVFGPVIFVTTPHLLATLLLI